MSDWGALGCAGLLRGLMNHGHSVHMVTGVSVQADVDRRKRWLVEYGMDGKVGLHIVWNAADPACHMEKAKIVAKLGCDIHVDDRGAIFEHLAKLSPKTIQLQSLRAKDVFLARRGK